jgi:hypothetical protein
MRNMALASVAVRDRGLAGDVPEMPDVVRDQDQLDAGQRTRLREIRDLETRVSVRAAQDKGVQTSVGDVVNRYSGPDR